MSQNLYDSNKFYPDTYSTGGSFGGEGFSTGGSFGADRATPAATRSIGGAPDLEPPEGLTPGNGTKAISKPKDALAAYLKSRKKGSMGGGGGQGVPMPQPRPQGLGQQAAPFNPYGGHTYTDPNTGATYNIPQGSDGAPMQMINAGRGVQTFMGNMGKAMQPPQVPPMGGQPMQLPLPQQGGLQGLQNAPATMGGLAGQGSPIAMLAKLFGG
jgi:hypothetical protein